MRLSIGMADQVSKTSGNGRILPLPPDAISQIHSSKHITSLQGVVLALLENSLDAEASKVHIDVDFRRGDCTVEDNGHGIRPVEFTERGGLGKLYHTSKRDVDGSRSGHGSTGTYITSLAALSLLVLTSRRADCEEQATISLHQGKVIARQVPSAPGNQLARFTAQGTAVTVRDLFGNMPVRVKQRALANEVGSEDEKAWQELKRGIVALLLAWRSPCSVRIQNSASGDRELSLAAYHPQIMNALTTKSLNQLAGRPSKFDLRDALPILTQAGLSSIESRDRWVPVSASTIQVSVKGLICLDASPIKQCQFISIGIQPCLAGSGHNELYDYVNKIFYNSSFGTVVEGEEVDDREKDRRKRDRRYKIDGFTRQQLQGKKGVDKFPMFVLQVMFKDSAAHQTLYRNMSDHQLKGVIEVLEATIAEWLTAHHFRPQKRRRRKNEMQTAPSTAVSNTSAPSSQAHTPTTRKGLTLPSLKRSAPPSESPVLAKRRHVSANPERPRTTGPVDGAMTRNQSTYFTSWSRIKSGRDAFYDDLWQNEKPATAPSEQIEHTLRSCEIEAATPIRVPSSVSIGERREALSKHDEAEANSPRARLPSAHAVENGERDSDDFGSVDEGEPQVVAEQMNRGRVLEESGLRNAEDEANGEPVVGWVDPITKQQYRVNTRTGVVLPPGKAPAAATVEYDRRRPAAINTRLSSARKAITTSRKEPTGPEDDTTGWLTGFLKDWKNPIFSRQDQESIPVAAVDGAGVTLEKATVGQCNHRHMDQHFHNTGEVGTSKLHKDGLKRVQVIAQVDQKFILCKMPAHDPSDSTSTLDKTTLVLVDQHAASERILLESLFVELCSPPTLTATPATFTPNTGYRTSITTTLLDKSSTFHISRQEHDLFSAHAAHFAKWGILYDLHTHTPTPSASQVRAPKAEWRLAVRTLPPGIAERCTLHPHLLIDMLRTEIWKLADSPPLKVTAAKARSDEAPVSAEDSNWLHLIPSCPKGIVDMLNSRACRSAVMFNDVLTLAECEELLRRLAECVFPFVCAHGRVGMVPVVGLSEGGKDDGVGGRYGFNSLGAGESRWEKEEGFGFKWRKWRGRVEGILGGEEGHGSTAR